MKKMTIPFLDQSRPSPETLNDMTKRGLIVPTESKRRLGAYDGLLSNATAGDVVSYKPLAALLRDHKITTADAKALLWVEGNRRSGEPRRLHIDRLLIVAFAEIKAEVLNSIYG